MCGTLLVVTALLAQAPNAAPAPAEASLPPAPRRLYLQVGVHGTFMHYTQEQNVDTVVFSGPALDASLVLGGRIGKSWFVGGSATGFLFMPYSADVSPTDRELKSSYSSGVFVAVTGGYLAGAGTLELSVGPFVGGASDKWGGLGPAAAAGGTLELYEGLGLTARLVFAPMLLWFDRGLEPTRLFLAQVGASWRL